MSHLKGLTNLGVTVNSPHMGEWPNKIGAYMLNFAGIELLSFQYLNALEPTRQAFNKNLKLLLSARIARILELIDAPAKIPKVDKKRIKLLWQEAGELSKWRNRIAHNPVVPTWKPGSDPDRDPPDLIGVLDVRQLRSGNISDSISLAGLKILIDASADLAQRIHSSAKKL